MRTTTLLCTVLLLATATTSGCSGEDEPRTYAVRGKIADGSGAPIASVTVTIDHPAAGNSVLTDASGTYAFSGIPSGAYTLQFAKSGYEFDPAALDVTVGGGDVAAPSLVGARVGTTWPVSGRVATQGGAPIPGARISAGTRLVATTSASGSYAFSATNGTYALSAAASNWVFGPASTSVSVHFAPVADVDFVGTTAYAVSGRVTTAAGAAIAGVSIAVDARLATSTDATGAFSVTVPSGTHTLVPSLRNFEFTPPTLDVVVGAANVPGRNFVGRDVVTVVDCVVSGWSAWGTCGGGACGGNPGTQARTRTIVTQPQNGGLACPALQESQACTTSPCPINCQVGAWSAWSACSALCNGTQTRTRPITVAPAYGGTACPPVRESIQCNNATPCGRIQFTTAGSCVRVYGPTSCSSVRVSVNGTVLGQFPPPGPSAYYTVPSGTVQVYAWCIYPNGTAVPEVNWSVRVDKYPNCSGNSCVTDIPVEIICPN